MRFERHLSERLSAIEAAGLLRTQRVLSGAQGPTAELDGREVILLCSNNYLGLASHPALAAAHAEGAARWGVGSGASRLVSGAMTPHREAERALADFLGAPAALLFSTGYAANVGVLQALVGPEDLVLSDALNHASLIDGCRLSRARTLVYRHRDATHLDELLAANRHTARAVLVVSDSLFSMDGDAAPLADLRRVADRWDAGLFLDEAHALGTLGPRGRGLAAAAAVRPDVLVGTLGKAFGLSGAFVAGSPDLIRLVENRARSFVFSTAPGPALASVVPTAVRLVDGADAGRARLAAHADLLRQRLAAAGLDVIPSSGPIVPVMIGAPTRAMQMSARLLELGVFVQGIRPPTVPAGTARLRVVPIATHEDEHLRIATAAFDTLARDLPR